MQNYPKDIPELYILPQGENNPDSMREKLHIVKNTEFQENHNVEQARKDIGQILPDKPEPKETDLRTMQSLVFNRGNIIYDARLHRMRSQPGRYPVNQDGGIVNKINKFLNVVHEYFFEKTTINDLIEQESNCGGLICGNESKRIFNMGPTDWYIVDNLKDSQGNVSIVTTHYAVCQGGFFKTSSEIGVTGEFISGRELLDFVEITKRYHDLVIKKYNYNPQPSQLLVVKNSVDQSYSDKIAA